MKSISRDQVLARICFENPWWNPPHEIDPFYTRLKERAYFDLFFPLLEQRNPTRALLLMGPRRVGKTVILHQAIRKLMRQKRIEPQTVCYINVENPIYNGLGLSELLEYAREASGVGSRPMQFVFFDEIQYLREWERHLKTLVESFPEIKFIASGSAAAALRLKSIESGAGRFTDFLLPPLTFFEYLELLGRTDLIAIMEQEGEATRFAPSDIGQLNRNFVDYLNYGGYPEAIFSPEIQANPGRFIRSDIINKVLLRDLPSLYGIQDIQELNSLFTMLAYNTGDEVSLEEISKNSGVAKNTIKKYIEYLEAAFLLKIVHRVDRSARKFKRANFFKVYLTNPCMRSALFSPISEDDPSMGHLVETAIFAQWFHSPVFRPHYARWNDGEVDIVAMDPAMSPSWIAEVKWSDAYEKEPGKLRSVIRFCKERPQCFALVTTRTQSSEKKVGPVQVRFVPASVYAFLLGYNIIRSKKDWPYVV